MISVIIPVYNAQKTLSECVQSLLKQTYSDYELVLIDDGSTDGSGRLCDELKVTCEKRGIQCQVIHKDNGGVSSARNCGLENAKGEYFVCVDSDDVVEPCYLEDLVRTAEAHSEFGHVICGFRCTSHVHDYIFTDSEPLTILDRRDYMRLADKILIQSPCLALYRTDIVRANSIRMPENLSLAEDILFNLDYLDVLDRTTIGVINKPNYIYRDEDQYSLNRKYRQNLLTINEMVMMSVEHYLNKWGVTDDASWQKYHNANYYRYCSVLNNTFHKQNPMTKKEKLAFNNEVMKREGFRDALKNCTAPILPALRRAYESGDYRKVLAVERMQRIKDAVYGIIHKR